MSHHGREGSEELEDMRGRALAAEARAEATERERSQLKVRLDVSRGCRKLAESESAALRAEVERLRADACAFLARYNAENAKLAVAHALLKQSQKPQTAVERARWQRDRDAHLASAPAAAPLSDDLGKALVQVIDAEHSARTLTAAEQAVLDASVAALAHFTDDDLRATVADPDPPELGALSAAELARREAAK